MLQQSKVLSPVTTEDSTQSPNKSNAELKEFTWANNEPWKSPAISTNSSNGSEKLNHKFAMQKSHLQNPISSAFNSKNTKHSMMTFLVRKDAYAMYYPPPRKFSVKVRQAKIPRSSERKWKIYEKRWTPCPR